MPSPCSCSCSCSSSLSTPLHHPLAPLRALATAAPCCSKHRMAAPLLCHAMSLGRRFPRALGRPSKTTLDGVTASKIKKFGRFGRTGPSLDSGLPQVRRFGIQAGVAKHFLTCTTLQLLFALSLLSFLFSLVYFHGYHAFLIGSRNAPTPGHMAAFFLVLALLPPALLVLLLLLFLFLFCSLWPRNVHERASAVIRASQAKSINAYVGARSRAPLA